MLVGESVCCCNGGAALGNFLCIHTAAVLVAPTHPTISPLHTQPHTHRQRTALLMVVLVVVALVKS